MSDTPRGWHKLEENAFVPPYPVTKEVILQSFSINLPFLEEETYWQGHVYMPDQIKSTDKCATAHEALEQLVSLMDYYNIKGISSLADCEDSVAEKLWYQGEWKMPVDIFAYLNGFGASNKKPDPEDWTLNIHQTLTTYYHNIPTTHDIILYYSNVEFNNAEDKKSFWSARIKFINDGEIDAEWTSDSQNIRDVIEELGHLMKKHGAKYLFRLSDCKNYEELIWHQGEWKKVKDVFKPTNYTPPDKEVEGFFGMSFQEQEKFVISVLKEHSTKEFNITEYKKSPDSVKFKVVVGDILRNKDVEVMTLTIQENSDWSLVAQIISQVVSE